MTKDDCILLGFIAKTHGVRGELILRTDRVSPEPDKKWGSLFLELDGILVPFFIQTLHHLRGDDWVVGFDEIGSMDHAAVYTGRKVWAPTEIAGTRDKEVSPDCLTGFTLKDLTSNRSGLIRQFIDIQENPVFEIQIGEESHLVPAREEFILEFDLEARTITMELPEGLL